MISDREKKRRFKKYGITYPSLGDVLAIPVDDENVYLAQVLAYYHEAFYIVVFDYLSPTDAASDSIDKALASPPLLAGLTFDARIRPGALEMWSIVGSRPYDQGRFLPAYRARARGVWQIQDLDRSSVRLARPGEEEHFVNRKITDPMVFQDVLHALNDLDHELADWRKVYADLDATKVVLARDVF